jgi:hypothetical protein
MREKEGRKAIRRVGHLDHSVGEEMQDPRVEEDRGDKSPPFVAIEDQPSLLRAIANLRELSAEGVKEMRLTMVVAGGPMRGFSAFGA